MKKLSRTGIIFLIAYILIFAYAITTVIIEKNFTVERIPIFIVFPLGIVFIATDPVFKNADSDTNTKN